MGYFMQGTLTLSASLRPLHEASPHVLVRIATGGNALVTPSRLVFFDLMSCVVKPTEGIIKGI